MDAGNYEGLMQREGVVQTVQQGFFICLIIVNLSPSNIVEVVKLIIKNKFTEIEAMFSKLTV